MYAPDDAAPLMTFVSLDEALGTEWPTDAHFVTYRLVDPQGQTGPHPRLNKSLLPHARERGCEIFATCFALDADTPGHVPWTDQLFRQFLTSLDRVYQRRPEFANYTAFYTTFKGARLVYVLDQPIPVDEAESRHRTLVSEFIASGLMVDKLSDWTRLFRLPKVMRAVPGGGMFATQSASTFLLDLKSENRLTGRALPMLSPVDQTTSYVLATVDLNRPTEQEVWSILYEIGENSNYQKSTAFALEAKRRLKGRECYDCLFAQKPLGPKGQRNQIMHAYVGQAIGLLLPGMDINPKHVYALFYDAASQLEPDAETADWTAVLWDHVCRLWAKEKGKYEAKVKSVEGDPVQRSKLLTTLSTGMRSWCNDERLFSTNDGEVACFIQRYFIATSGRYNFVLDRNGRYGQLALGDSQLVPFLRTSKLDEAIPTRKLASNGATLDVQVTDIKNNYSYPVAPQVELEPEIDGGYVRDFPDDKRPGITPTLVLPCYRRNPWLEPQFDPDVDEWLRVFLGDQYDAGCRWLAWAPAFDLRETCAISLVGPPGAGKKLFVQGLAEILETPRLASAEDLVGTYQYGLKVSPFVVVNEGWPQSRNRHPSDAFRSIVSGDDQVINEKYLPPMLLKSFPRVIFTANNFELISKLAEGKQLTNEDRDALSQRLLHVDLGRQAGAWLKRKGGYSFTGSKGRRWIAGKGGKSDYVLARHYLWLYANRGVEPQTRFLVEGNASEEVLFALQTRVGNTPLVIETILSILRLTNPRSHGVIVEPKRILTTPKAVVDYYRQQPAHGKPLDTNAVIACLKTIAAPGNKPTLPKNRNEEQEKYWELNLDLLKQVALRDGWDTELLEKIISGDDISFGVRVNGGPVNFGGRLGEAIKQGNN